MRFFNVHFGFLIPYFFNCLKTVNAGVVNAGTVNLTNEMKSFVTGVNSVNVPEQCFISRSIPISSPSLIPVL